MGWTRKRVLDELGQALNIVENAADPAFTLLRAQPKHHIVRNPNESFGYDDLSETMPPTEDDENWALERIRWTRWLDDDTKKLVRLRAKRVPWNVIKRRDIPKHRSRSSLTNVVNKGLDSIIWRLDTIDQHKK